MQQPTSPNLVAAPTFWQTVMGSMIGIFGCFVVSLLVFGCLFVVFFAALAPRFNDIFSRIAPGLRVP